MAESKGLSKKKLLFRSRNSRNNPIGRDTRLTVLSPFPLILQKRIVWALFPSKLHTHTHTQREREREREREEKLKNVSKHVIHQTIHQYFWVLSFAFVLGYSIHVLLDDIKRPADLGKRLYSFVEVFLGVRP